MFVRHVRIQQKPFVYVECSVSLLLQGWRHPVAAEAGGKGQSKGAHLHGEKNRRTGSLADRYVSSFRASLFIMEQELLLVVLRAAEALELMW